MRPILRPTFRSLSSQHFLGLAFCLFLITGPVIAQQPRSRVLVTGLTTGTARTVMLGNVHPLARAEFDQGEAPAQMSLRRMLLVLKRSDEQEIALRHLIENQQYKKSSSYHVWLTPQEFGERFGVADSDLVAVVNWLKASGFQVTQISAGRTVIEFSGTVGQIRQAFQTSIHRYVIDGEEHWANSSDPSIPSSLAPVVAGIDSLHDFGKQAQYVSMGTYSEDTKQLNPPNPDFTYAGCGSSCYAVSPYDFATIYDVLPLWNGTPAVNGSGQTIAIVGRTDINPADAPTFWGLFGLDGVHAPQPTLIITYNGPKPSINQDESEADIDTQWSGAVAPGATINFVTSESTETTDGVDLSALYIVDNNLAPVMSESYGQCEKGLGTGGVQFYGSLWEQAAAQGISVMVSTGDNGAAGCDNPSAVAQNGLNVNGLASTPWNAAVGGTDFNEYQKWSTYWNATNNATTQESAKSYIPETTWDDSCTNPLFQFLQGGSTDPEKNCNNPSFSGYLDSEGGSGGESAAWLKPTWQTGTPNDNARDLPDISLFASNGFLGSFYVICQRDVTGGQCNLNSLAAYGGTSVASPAFAGIMALVNQKYGPQGVPGLILYALASKQPNAFHDVPSGTTIAMPCVAGSPNCTTKTQGDHYGVLSGFSTGPGFDLATGLGSVDVSNLVQNWGKVTFTPTTTSLSLNSGNPVNVTHGTAVSVGIGVSPANPKPTGDVALLVSPGTPGNPGFDSYTLSQGAVNGTTSMLPGGNYGVIAHYAGDTNYGGSYSSPVSVTVNPENSSVYMPGLDTGTDGNGNPVYATSVVYGSSYLLRADVQNAQGKFCSPFDEIACPSGSVSFTDNGQPLDQGTYELNSKGYTEDRAIQLPGGPHTLGANYSGDASYHGSSATTTIAITPAPTNFEYLNTSGAWEIVNQPFAIRAEVIAASLGVPEGGTFTFFADGVALTGTVAYTFSGNCGNDFYVCLAAEMDGVTFSSSGTHTVDAQYSGDPNYSGSTTPPVAVPVYYQTTTALSANPLNPPAGGSTTLTALIDTPAKNLNPTGTVTFSYYGGSQLPGTPTLTPVTNSNGNSALQATLNFTPISNSSTIAAVYSGDSNYLQSGSGAYTVVVGGDDFAFTASGSTLTVSRGQTGAVSFGIDGQASYNATINFAPSSCSGLPSQSSASFSPTSVTGSGGTTLFIATTAPQAVRAAKGGALLGWRLACLMPFAGMILLLRGRRWCGFGMVLALILLAITLVSTGCGGGSGGTGGTGGGGGTGTGTPTGSYTITVTATDGTHTHSATFTLVVQ